MTDEQIKQNADNYTESLMCENLHRTMYSSIDFIEGAHSRDEEIKELEKRIKVIDLIEKKEE